MSVRLPSGPEYAPRVLHEYQWLPRLAPHLPLPIPEPLALGKPDQGFPVHWTINRWLDGRDAEHGVFLGLDEIATDLAEFLAALQSVDANDAPRPSAENFFRGGDLSVYDPEVHECLEILEDIVDADAIARTWGRALDSENRRSAAWLHGDVTASNLLCSEGRLCGVIDFGQLAVGDPACDLTIAWTFFAGGSRRRFRDRLALHDEVWLRARGWALWKALVEIRTCTDHAGRVRAQEVVRIVLSDD